MWKHRSLSISAILLVALAAAGTGSLLAGKGNVDELRFGTELDASGEIDAQSHGDEFPDGVTLYASMRVEEAPQGTELMLTIVDRETEETVWSGAKAVPGGHAKLRFSLPDAALNPGKYRAKVKLGDDWVAEHEFQVV